MIPKIQITENGYIVPTTEEIFEGVWSEIQTIFGQSISRVQGNPQYQLATSWTATIKDCYDQQVALGNQFDPRYAEGIYQDALGEIYFMKRKLSTKSVAVVTFTGLTGANIPQGFIVQDINGNQWATTGAVMISPNGVVTATVQCTVGGAIVAEDNTITIIPVALAGLDSVTNEQPAIVGLDEESRSDFESRRQDSVAINSKLTDNAVRGAVSSLNDVVDVFVYSNNSDSPTTIGTTSYPMDAHSLVVSVVGGIDYDIALQTLIKGGTGCGFMGNTTVTVYDTDTYPQQPPAYEVKFLRPDLTEVFWKITLVDISKMSLADSNAMKQAVLTGMKTGTTRGRIGGTLRPITYVSRVASSASSVELESIEVSLDGTTWVNIIELGVDQFPISDEDSIEIV